MPRTSAGTNSMASGTACYWPGPKPMMTRNIMTDPNPRLQTQRIEAAQQTFRVVTSALYTPNHTLSGESVSLSLSAVVDGRSVSGSTVSNPGPGISSDFCSIPRLISLFNSCMRRM